MQMGRWFGYRAGYEDLCRLYLSEELAEWYGHITDAAEELRGEFDRMVLTGGTPMDFGIRVKDHPVMSISGKLRPGLPTIRFTLSATPFEPTVFHEDPDSIRKNWFLTSELLDRMGLPPHFPVVREDSRGRWPGAAMWQEVPGNEIALFLQRFKFADEKLRKTPSGAVVDYISRQLKLGELTKWTVVALGRGRESQSSTEPSVKVAAGSIQLNTIYRNRQPTRHTGMFVVKRIGSPKDESIDLPQETWKEVESLARLVPRDTQENGYTTGALIRAKRAPSNGLLILYLVTPPPDGPSAALSEPLVAPYISFPHSPTAKAEEYKVGHVYWMTELLGVE